MPPKKSVRRTASKKGQDALPRLDDFQRCCSCQSLIEKKLTKGFNGKGDDPISFPQCEHAMHASCLVSWYLGTLGTRERATLVRRGKKRMREFALSEYDRLFGGRCETCARRAPVRPASVRSEACRRESVSP